MIINTTPTPAPSYGAERVSPGVTRLWLRTDTGWVDAGIVTRGNGNTLKLNTGTRIIKAGNYEELAWKVKEGR